MANELVTTIDGTSKTSGTECFTADLEPVANGIYRIEVSGSVAHALEVTFNSGTNWHFLNGGVDLAVDNLYIFDVVIRTGDLFNMRQASGTVVFDILRIYRVD